MKGILLINLGSTKSPKVKDVKAYLDEFLMDKYAMDLPYKLRAFVVRGLILRSRPPKTAANYKRIWWEEGSPLIVISERVRDRLNAQLDIPAALGMRYGEPSLHRGLKTLVDQGVDEVLLFPLYPQYTMATVKTAIERVKEIKKENYNGLTLKVLSPFYEDSDYINVLSKSITDGLKGKDYDHLLFSYHGIPKRHERKVNFKRKGQKITYREQCIRTSQLVAQQLGLKEEQYSTSFQSRLGPDPWIKPYTDKFLQSLPQKGVKKLAIVAPAFVADCIETIDEIDREGREEFINAGGEEFIYIPCLNDREDWIKVLKKWAEKV